MCLKERETKRKESNEIFLLPKNQQKQEMRGSKRVREEPKFSSHLRAMEVGDKREREKLSER